LHCHTEYSLLDGLARVGPLMDAAQKQGMTSLALTDHGVMFGAVEFYGEAKKRGIKPIIGMEAYVAPRAMHLREGKQDASGYHFVLLAENEIGYQNLLTLASEAQLRGYYYKPRVDKELLAKHSAGLIALSACLSSEVARHLVKDDIQAAEKAAKWYAEVFENRFYLEVQDHGIAEQRTVNRHIAAMAKRLSLPLVVTNDVHYIAKEHAQAQEILLCVQTGTTMDDPKRMKMDSHEFYLKSADEMWQTFGDEFPNALKNTMEIAERCNLNLEFGRVQLPEMPVPAGHSVDTYLAEVCHDRLAVRYDEVRDDMKERLDYELSVIKKTGFAAYFLLLDDIIGHARREGIMVGPGRGCLSPDTPIEMSMGGVKAIRDVEPGDCVISRDGMAREVIRRWDYESDEDLIRLRSYYGDWRGVTLTPDHKVLAEKSTRKPGYEGWADSTKRAKKSLIEPTGRLDWLRADELAPGDWVFCPTLAAPSSKRPPCVIDLARYANGYDMVSSGDEVREYRINVLLKRLYHRATLPRLITLDEAWGRILGLFAGDGWLLSHKSNRIGFAFNAAETESRAWVEEFFHALNLQVDVRPHAGRKLVQIEVKSKFLRAMFADLFDGYAPILKARDKHVPRAILEGSMGLQQGFVRGLCMSDGHDAGSKNRIATTSLRLAVETRQLLRLLGVPSAVRKENRKAETRAAFINAGTSYTVDFPPDARFGANDAMASYVYRRVEGGFLLKLLSSELVPGTGTVHDLEVAGEHNYLTSSFLVHNSAVGSLASYCLGITNVDPLQFDLLFERFLNPDRLSMPDIDTDFADDRRDEVIRYITERFGADCVAQISTFGTMAAKAAIKDVGRALAIPYGDVDRLCKLIPLMPLKITIRESIDAVPELADLYNNNDEVKRHLDMAMALEHVKRHASTHAAGVVISHDPLVNVTPLIRVGKEGEQGQASQYEAGILDKIGLLKMDILGLTTLTLIQRTVRNIEISRGVLIESDEIPLDDPCIYDLLTSGETAGIFQLESGAMRKVLRDMKPDRFTDIVAVVALYRPGPMNFIPQYIARKNGSEKVTYLHEDLEPILRESYGVIVYQDQVLRIAIEFAGFTWGEADKLRKAMGKKLIEEMKKQQAHFDEGFAKTTKWVYQQDETGAPTAVEVPKPAYPVKLAHELWPLMETFAGYGFNKCSHAQTKVMLPDGSRVPLAAAFKRQPEEIMAMWPDGEIRPHKVYRIVKTGRKELLKVKTQGGRVIKVTPEHRLLTIEGYKRVDEMQIGLELMTSPRKLYAPHQLTEKMHQARRTNITQLNQSREQRERVSMRVAQYQADRPQEDKVAHMKRMHALHPDMTRNAVAAMHERVKWLWANDSDWRVRWMEATFAATRAVLDTGPGYGRCSIASNGMWCASQNERDMCEWLIAQGVDFEMHKVLPNGRICDFYFAGVYWEMDGMDRAPAYFADKYGDLPYVVVTPEDFKFGVEHHLALEHAQNGDPIISIEPCGEAMTYDVEMAPDGPLNYLANDIVSHNSHAAAYAQLACQTAYLKAKYKVEYMAACLSIETGSPDRMAVVLGECRRLGITILPPDVNHSDLDFAVEGDSVRYALQAIKNVGANAIRSIVTSREKDGPFKDVDDFSRRVDWKAMNKRALESLIKAGALDSLGDRALLLGNLDRIVSQGQRAERDAASGQVSLFADVADIEALALPSLILTTVPDVPTKQLLAWEKEMLGLYISEHPLTACQEQGRLLGVVSIAALGPSYATKKVKLGAQITTMRQILTKKSETMMALELEDLEGTIEAVAFPRTYARFKELFTDSAILLVAGTVDMRNDRLQLIIDDVSIFEGKVSSGVERFSVYCRRSGDDERDLALVQDVYLLLREFPGKDKVQIVTDRAGRRVPIPLPDGTSCCCPELLERLRALPGIGPDAVEIVSVAPPAAPAPIIEQDMILDAPLSRGYVDPFAALDSEDDVA